MVYLYAAAAVFLGVFGQLFLKMGASNLFFVNTCSDVAPRAGAWIETLFQAILQPYTWLGFFLYGISSLFWLLILSRLPLSSAYPILAMNFVLITLVSVVFLGETISTGKIIGTLLIIAGVVVIGR